MYLRDSQITTSVRGGAGQGGDINLSDPIFVALNKSLVRAQADEGRGGDIHIKSEQFITTPDSVVSASSRLGLDGEVKIDSPDTDVSGILLVLPASFVDASGQLKPPCSAVGRNKNTFVAKRFAGGPALPSGLQSNRLVLLQAKDETTSSSEKKAEQSVPLKIAFVNGCQPDSYQAK